MPQKSIKITRKDPTPGTCYIHTGSGWNSHNSPPDYKSCEIEFKGPRGKRQHTQYLTGADFRKFAQLLTTCGAADKKVKEDLLELLCYLYFQSGKRVAMYLDNAQEIAAVLNMFADELEKKLGHPL